MFGSVQHLQAKACLSFNVAWNVTHVTNWFCLSGMPWWQGAGGDKALQCTVAGLMCKVCWASESSNWLCWFTRHIANILFSLFIAFSQSSGNWRCCHTEPNQLLCTEVFDKKKARPSLVKATPAAMMSLFVAQKWRSIQRLLCLHLHMHVHHIHLDAPFKHN